MIVPAHLVVQTKPTEIDVFFVISIFCCVLLVADPRHFLNEEKKVPFNLVHFYVIVVKPVGQNIYSLSQFFCQLDVVALVVECYVVCILRDLTLSIHREVKET